MGPVEVAIKTLRSKASEEERVKFLQEAAIIGQFHHPNIVKLHGVVTVGDPVSMIVILLIISLLIHNYHQCKFQGFIFNPQVMIVLELMKNSDLKNYLHAHRPM